MYATPLGLFEIGKQQIQGNSRKLKYPISRNENTQVHLPSSSTWIGYKYLIENSKNAVKRSGNSGDAFTLGFGPSSATLLKDSPHIEQNRPFLESKQVSGFLEFSLGWYFSEFDWVTWLAYRDIPFKQKGFGFQQEARREVTSIEVYKYLFDWLGFVPFLGLSINQDRLSLKEIDNGILTTNVSKKINSIGVIFGWDIRPDNKQSVILRTCLRYSPNLSLDIPTTNKQIHFDMWELNFIQAVIHFR